MLTMIPAAAAIFVLRVQLEAHARWTSAGKIERIEMRTSAKMIVAFLFFINILAVCMGYAGINKLQRYQHPPFHNHRGLWTVVYAAKHVPDEIVVFWHSTLGTCLVWGGSILLPLAAAYLIFVREKLWTGAILLLMSLVPFGLVGFLIWLHAFCDLPHEW
jgi:hypothetical protein